MLATSVASALPSRTRVSCMRRSNARREYNTVGRRTMASTHGFFEPSQKLIDQRTATKGLHYVFLEGVAGSGKASLLERLQKIGYTTQSLPYVKFCSAVWHTTHFAPNSTTAGMFWLAEWTKQLELIQHAHKKGQQHKDSVIFVQRSPLTNWVHDISRMQPPSRTNVWLRIMDDLKQQFSASTILCYSDDIRTKERLGERMFWAEGESKAIRTALHEEDADLQQLFDSKYKELVEKEWLDGNVATTDSKQACAEILTKFGLDNWDSFKQQTFGSKKL